MVINNNDDKIINHGEHKKRKMKHCLFWLDSGLKNPLWQFVSFACLPQQWMKERVVTISDSASFAAPLAWQWKQMSQSNELFSEFLIV